MLIIAYAIVCLLLATVVLSYGQADMQQQPSLLQQELDNFIDCQVTNLTHHRRQKIEHQQQLATKDAEIAQLKQQLATATANTKHSSLLKKGEDGETNKKTP
jgi:cytochrome c-type biogenesis protein CcmH/NrfG